MQSEKTNRNDALSETEHIFAGKVRDIVRNGMQLVNDRLRFAKKHDKQIREAVCAIEYESDEKASQIKALVEALKRVTLVDTSEVLSLVTKALDRQQSRGGDDDAGKSEIVVTLDEGVEKWAK